MDTRLLVSLGLFLCLTIATLLGFWLFKRSAQQLLSDRLVLAGLPIVLIATLQSSLYQI